MVLSKFAKLTKRVARKLNSAIAQVYLSSPKTVECNLCGWQGKHFLNSDWHPQTVCPKCGSQVRHRLLVACLSHISGFSHADILENKQVLHFAPEPLLKQIFSKYSGSYKTADLFKEGVDIKLDISDMSSLRDQEIDLLVACDVIEHVKDDKKALKEIYRVLSNGGYAMITVPQKDNLEKTFEELADISGEERNHLLGHPEHWRIYGNDFPLRLEEAGFKVRAIDKDNFPESLVKRHILFPPVLSDNPLATNYRKVFFAQKS